MYKIARKVLFSLDPEVSHEVSLSALNTAEKLSLLPLIAAKAVQSPVEVMGLTFPNAVGLAAGLDKNGDYFNALGQMGFGFVEIGTITPVAQTGNPKPRLFRLTEHQAIINRMGFNNKGVEHLVEQVAKPRRFEGLLGINIGKNKVTPEEDALDDYVKCLKAVYDYADYVTVNISSPNTPGLRNLQFGESLDILLRGLKKCQAELQQKRGRRVPLVVKLAPDANEAELRGMAGQMLANGIDGVIATNTTIDRDKVADSVYAQEAGGLSGAPLTQKSTEAIRVLCDELGDKIPVIGVGGIMCADDAKQKLDAGAKLVQLYSGFIFQGPQLIKEVAEACASALQVNDNANASVVGQALNG